MHKGSNNIRHMQIFVLEICLYMQKKIRLVSQQDE